MNRRNFLQSIGLLSGAALVTPAVVMAAEPAVKVSSADALVYGLIDPQILHDAVTCGVISLDEYITRLSAPDAVTPLERIITKARQNGIPIYDNI